MKRLKISVSFLFLFLSLSVVSHSAFSALSYNRVKSHSFLKDSVVKILAIGNSFSDDAIEHYLYGLAKEGGHTVIIANLYIGGAPLELHVKNIRANKSVYSYRKIAKDGTKTITPKISIETALADEDWDYISLQQASSFSGMLETVQKDLPELYQYVKARAKNPDVKYIYHQTWAYAQSSTHKGFANYNNNQDNMYKGIVNVSKNVKKIVPVDIIIPAGTAIQNARTSFVGDSLTRDGYHLNVLGRYTASCTWYTAIFKDKVIGKKYAPEKLSENEIAVAQQAASYAVKKPFIVKGLKK